MATLEEAVDDFLAQEHIAVTGVSRKTEGSGNAIYRRLKDSGHQVYAVNPNAETFDGDPCYPNLKSIPHHPDGVVIVNRPEVVEEIVRECVEVGVSRVWLHQSMRFMGGSYSEPAVTFGRENNITVISGGCPMMYCQPVDFGHKMMRWMCGFTGVLPDEV